MKFILISVCISLSSCFSPVFVTTGRIFPLQATKSPDESLATIFTASVFLVSSLTVSAPSFAETAIQGIKPTTTKVVDVVRLQKDAIKGYRDYLISTSKALSAADKAEITTKAKAEKAKQDVIVGEKKLKTAQTLQAEVNDKYNKLKKKSDKVAVQVAKDNLAAANQKVKSEEANLKALRSSLTTAEKTYTTAQATVLNTRKAEIKAKETLLQAEKKLLEVQKQVANDKQQALQKKAKAQKLAEEAQRKKNEQAAKAKVAAVKQKAAQREKEVRKLREEKEAKAKAEKDARVKARVDEQKRLEKAKADEKKRIEFANKQEEEKAKTVQKLKGSIKELEKKKVQLEKNNDKRGLINLNRELDLQKKELDGYSF